MLTIVCAKRLRKAFKTTPGRRLSGDKARAEVTIPGTKYTFEIENVMGPKVGKRKMRHSDVIALQRS